MTLRALSELKVRALHAAAKPCSVRVDAGLYFRIQKDGQRPAWLFRYKRGGKGRWMMIGHFPDMPMSEAQKRARAQRVALDDGKDPQIERLRERQAISNQISVTEVANRWHADEIVGRVQHPEIPQRCERAYNIDQFVREIGVES